MDAQRLGGTVMTAMRRFLLALVLPVVAWAHTDPLPVVTVHLDADAHGVSCVATIPTFALPPLAEVDADTSRAALPAYYAAIADTLDRQCPVRIDGVKMAPVVSLVELYAPPIRDPATYPPGVSPLAMPWVQATVAYGYPTKAPPREVVLTWGIFPQDAAQDAGIVREEVDDLQETLVVSRAFGRERIVCLDAEGASYVWHADDTDHPAPMSAVTVTPPPPLSVPILSLVAVLLCVGAGIRYCQGRLSRRLLVGVVIVSLVLGWVGYTPGRIAWVPPWARDRVVPDTDASRGIFSALLTHVYRAFDLDEESEIYDALAYSVAGPMLERVYLDVFKAMSDDEGPYVQIDQVDVVDYQMAVMDGAPPRFGVECTWQVKGIVEHLTHVHRRVNAYRGRFTVAAMDGHWKIVDVRLKGYERITP